MFSQNYNRFAAPEQRWTSKGQMNLLELQDQLLVKHFDRNGQDDDSSVRLVDSFLAKEFNTLSVQERSRTYEELHGVNDCVEESPILLHTSLRQLDEALTRITVKRAYDIAEHQNKDYVRDTNFRLMFLRADGFHPERAATRMVAFFEGKLQYFGESLLTKRIQFSDLDQDDQACLQAGHLQILPSRDRSGRAIMVAVDIFENKSYRTPTNKLKANIFTWLVLAEDEENQKRGVVLIVIQTGAMDLFARANPTLAREFPRLQSWFPIRVCALHCCSDTTFAEFLLRAAVIGAPADMRARHRSHNGNYTEILYSLLGYGIPVDLIPSSDGVLIKKTNWSRWIAKYMARDKELSSSGGTIFLGVDLPTRNDVLMGKGRPIQNHHGNVHLRMLVEACSDKYHAARRSTEKLDVVLKVFAMIQASHGRFLRKDDDGWWRELTNVDAVDKVKKLFQRPVSTEKLQRDHSAHAKPDDGADYASMFLQQGKRPKFDAGCCGT
jgi:hypothetical protein